MDDNQFWVNIWRCVGWTLVGFTAISATSCQITNLEIRQSIQAGADPMQAACALSTGAYNDSVCVAAMMRKQDK